MNLPRWFEEDDEELRKELIAANPVVECIKYRRFVSKSKGRRNGRKRLRKNWKEIHLVRFMQGEYHQWHRFPFDVYATEILGQKADGEELKKRIEELWGY
jgi:hypothetical protein